MADMVEAALVQEAVSRGVSLLLGDREEEKPSKVHDIEKLEMLRSQLEFALETSKNLPILSLPLLFQRQMLKRRYEECGDLLHERKRRAVEDKEAEKAVTRSSFPRRIVHAVRSSVSSFLSMNRDEFCRSGLGRFEWYADKAGEFIRDIQSSCSLARYRFFSPLIRPLLEGKTLTYQMEQGSRSHRLRIWSSAPTEGHGVVAHLSFRGYDRKIPTKCFTIWLRLRLSESTDIVGMATKCLESLGPQYKSLTQVAMGELSQLPTQDFFHCPDPDLSMRIMKFLGIVLVGFQRPNPSCCRANGHMPCANNIIPSELSNRFPEEVISMDFDCSIPAFEYNLQSSAERNVVNDWPPLKLSAHFEPHHNSGLWGGIYALERFGGQVERINGTSLQQMDEMVLTNAISCFIRQPELTNYEMYWNSPHGMASFTVGKPKEKVHPQPRAGPKTRRAAKEKALIRS